VVQAADARASLARVDAAGGEITAPIFESPSGRRPTSMTRAALGVWGD